MEETSPGIDLQNNLTETVSLDSNKMFNTIKENSKKNLSLNTSLVSEIYALNQEITSVLDELCMKKHETIKNINYIEDSSEKILNIFKSVDFVYSSESLSNCEFELQEEKFDESAFTIDLYSSSSSEFDEIDDEYLDDYQVNYNEFNKNNNEFRILCNYNNIYNGPKEIKINYQIIRNQSPTSSSVDDFYTKQHRRFNVRKKVERTRANTVNKYLDQKQKKCLLQGFVKLQKGSEHENINSYNYKTRSVIPKKIRRKLYRKETKTSLTENLPCEFQPSILISDTHFKCNKLLTEAETINHVYKNIKNKIEVSCNSNSSIRLEKSLVKTIKEKKYLKIIKKHQNLNIPLNLKEKNLRKDANATKSKYTIEAMIVKHKLKDEKLSKDTLHLQRNQKNKKPEPAQKRVINISTCEADLAPCNSVQNVQEIVKECNPCKPKTSRKSFLCCGKKHKTVDLDSNECRRKKSRWCSSCCSRRKHKRKKSKICLNKNENEVKLFDDPCCPDLSPLNASDTQCDPKCGPKESDLASSCSSRKTRKSKCCRKKNSSSCCTSCCGKFKKKSRKKQPSCKNKENECVIKRTSNVSLTCDPDEDFKNICQEIINGKKETTCRTKRNAKPVFPKKKVSPCVTDDVKKIPQEVSCAQKNDRCKMIYARDEQNKSSMCSLQNECPQKLNIRNEQKIDCSKIKEVKCTSGTPSNCHKELCPNKPSTHSFDKSNCRGQVKQSPRNCPSTCSQLKYSNLKNLFSSSSIIRKPCLQTTKCGASYSDIPQIKKCEPNSKKCRHIEKKCESIARKCDCIPKKCEPIPKKCESIPTKCECIPKNCDPIPKTCEFIPTKCEYIPKHCKPIPKISEPISKNCRCSRKNCEPKCELIPKKWGLAFSPIRIPIPVPQLQRFPICIGKGAPRPRMCKVCANAISVSKQRKKESCKAVSSKTSIKCSPNNKNCLLRNLTCTDPEPLTTVSRPVSCIDLTCISPKNNKNQTCTTKYASTSCRKVVSTPCSKNTALCILNENINLKNSSDLQKLILRLETACDPKAFCDNFWCTEQQPHFHSKLGKEPIILKLSGNGGDISRNIIMEIQAQCPPNANSNFLSCQSKICLEKSSQCERVCQPHFPVCKSQSCGSSPSCKNSNYSSSRVCPSNYSSEPPLCRPQSCPPEVGILNKPQCNPKPCDSCHSESANLPRQCPSKTIFVSPNNITNCLSKPCTSSHPQCVLRHPSMNFQPQCSPQPNPLRLPKRCSCNYLNHKEICSSYNPCNSLCLTKQTPTNQCKFVSPKCSTKSCGNICKSSSKCQNCYLKQKVSTLCHLSPSACKNSPCLSKNYCQHQSCSSNTCNYSNLAMPSCSCCSRSASNITTPCNPQMFCSGSFPMQQHCLSIPCFPKRRCGLHLCCPPICISSPRSSNSLKCSSHPCICSSELNCSSPTSDIPNTSCNTHSCQTKSSVSNPCSLKPQNCNYCNCHSCSLRCRSTNKYCEEKNKTSRDLNSHCSETSNCGEECFSTKPCKIKKMKVLKCKFKPRDKLCHEQCYEQCAPKKSQHNVKLKSCMASKSAMNPQCSLQFKPKYKKNLGFWPSRNKSKVCFNVLSKSQRIKCCRPVLYKSSFYSAQFNQHLKTKKSFVYSSASSSSWYSDCTDNSSISSDVINCYRNKQAIRDRLSRAFKSEITKNFISYNCTVNKSEPLSNTLSATFQKPKRSLCYGLPPKGNTVSCLCSLNACNRPCSSALFLSNQQNSCSCANSCKVLPSCKSYMPKCSCTLKLSCPPKTSNCKINVCRQIARCPTKSQCLTNPCDPYYNGCFGYPQRCGKRLICSNPIPSCSSRSQTNIPNPCLRNSFKSECINNSLCLHDAKPSCSISCTPQISLSKIPCQTCSLNSCYPLRSCTKQFQLKYPHMISTNCNAPCTPSCLVNPYLNIPTCLSSLSLSCNQFGFCPSLFDYKIPQDLAPCSRDHCSNLCQNIPCSSETCSTTLDQTKVYKPKCSCNKVPCNQIRHNYQSNLDENSNACNQEPLCNPNIKKCSMQPCFQKRGVKLSSKPFLNDSNKCNRHNCCKRSVSPLNKPGRSCQKSESNTDDECSYKSNCCRNSKHSFIEKACCEKSKFPSRRGKCKRDTPKIPNCFNECDYKPRCFKRIKTGIRLCSPPKLCSPPLPCLPPQFNKSPCKTKKRYKRPTICLSPQVPKPCVPKCPPVRCDDKSDSCSSSSSNNHCRHYNYNKFASTCHFTLTNKFSSEHYSNPRSSSSSFTNSSNSSISVQILYHQLTKKKLNSKNHAHAIRSDVEIYNYSNMLYKKRSSLSSIELEPCRDVPIQNQASCTKLQSNDYAFRNEKISRISKLRARVCSSCSIDFSKNIRIKNKSLVHPYVDVKSVLQKIGIKDLILASKPAKCCPLKVINQVSVDNIPYSPSLISLPLDVKDLKVILQSVRMASKKKYRNKIKPAQLDYITNLIKDDFNSKKPHETPCYEVRYFFYTLNETEKVDECTTEVRKKVFDEKPLKFFQMLKWSLSTKYKEKITCGGNFLELPESLNLKKKIPSSVKSIITCGEIKSSILDELIFSDINFRFVQKCTINKPSLSLEPCTSKKNIKDDISQNSKEDLCINLLTNVNSIVSIQEQGSFDDKKTHKDSSSLVIKEKNVCNIDFYPNINTKTMSILMFSSSEMTNSNGNLVKMLHQQINYVDDEETLETDEELELCELNVRCTESTDLLKEKCSLNDFTYLQHTQSTMSDNHTYKQGFEKKQTSNISNDLTKRKICESSKIPKAVSKLNSRKLEKPHISSKMSDLNSDEETDSLENLLNDYFRRKEMKDITSSTDSTLQNDIPLNDLPIQAEKHVLITPTETEGSTPQINSNEAVKIPLEETETSLASYANKSNTETSSTKEQPHDAFLCNIPNAPPFILKMNKGKEGHMNRTKQDLNDPSSGLSSTFNESSLGMTGLTSTMSSLNESLSFGYQKIPNFNMFIHNMCPSLENAAFREFVAKSITYIKKTKEDRSYWSSDSCKPRIQSRYVSSPTICMAGFTSMSSPFQNNEKSDQKTWGKNRTSLPRQDNPICGKLSDLSQQQGMSSKIPRMLHSSNPGSKLQKNVQLTGESKEQGCCGSRRQPQCPAQGQEINVTPYVKISVSTTCPSKTHNSTSTPPKKPAPAAQNLEALIGTATASLDDKKQSCFCQPEQEDEITCPVIAQMLNPEPFNLEPEEEETQCACPPGEQPDLLKNSHSSCDCSNRNECQNADFEEQPPEEPEVFWALTKVSLLKDGTKNFEIIDVSRAPPGYYIMPDVNNIVLVGPQPNEDEQQAKPKSKKKCSCKK